MVDKKQIKNNNYGDSFAKKKSVKRKFLKGLLTFFIIGVLALGSFLVHKAYFSNIISDTAQNNLSETQNNLSKYQIRAQEILQSMSLKDKIGQMFMLDTDAIVYGSRQELSAGVNLNSADQNSSFNKKELEELAKYNPGGIILFGGNIESKDQVKEFIASMQKSVKYPLFIGTDQEGGRVNRLKNAGIAQFSSMSEIGQTRNPLAACDVGAAFGKQMKEMGFNLDFAPVADVNTNPNNPVIGERSFGNDPHEVAKMVAEEVKCMQQENISSALKHFPGHGDTSTDSHTGLPTVETDLNGLKSVELVPFSAGINAGADFVLTAHISIPKVDPSGLPATMSKIILTDILQNDLKFSGLIITDALDMSAIWDNYSPREIVENCLNAGVDILLVPKDFYKTYNAFLDLAQSDAISQTRIDKSVYKILQTKLKRGIIS
ncbi:MAG: glycoside hydrolase family 3 protein [Bifidobacteriaceae bacterium]|nr:glycoside hydrolase family 3 protein [Bifidobacteriaceae bacterium]